MDKDTVVLLAARASRLENQDAIDAAIINMLADPKEVEEKTYNISMNVAWFIHVFGVYHKYFLPIGTCKHQRSAFSAFQSCGQAYCNYLY